MNPKPKNLQLKPRFYAHMEVQQEFEQNVVAPTLIT